MKRKEARDLKMQFGMWLAMPKDVRDPRDQKDFAVKLGVEPETLARWRKDPVVQEAMKNAQNVFLGQHRWEVLQATVEKAKSGSFQDRRLYFQLTGDLSKQVEEKKESQEVKIVIERADAPTEDKTALFTTRELYKN
jgi:hypothetical protein